MNSSKKLAFAAGYQAFHSLCFAEIIGLVQLRNSLLPDRLQNSYRTVRIYSGSNFEEVQVLDHQSPVQCIVVLDNGDILTGANDSAIKWWSNGQLKGTFNGHTDTVR